MTSYRNFANRRWISLAVSILSNNMQGHLGPTADSLSPPWKAKYMGIVSDIIRCQSLCYSLDPVILSTEEISLNSVNSFGAYAKSFRIASQSVFSHLVPKVNLQ